MQKVLTAAQIREVDRLTTERYGIPSIILMENAAHAVARVITEKLGGSVKGKSILILCGKGNNGGDGFALSRILWNQGADVTVCMMFPDDEVSGDAAENLSLLRRLHESQTEPFKPIICIAEVGTHRSFFDRPDPFLGPDIVVDAVFGTGLTRPLENELALLAKQYNSILEDEIRPIFLSIDIPGGLDSDLPEPIGESFAADVTVSFTAPKPSNIIPPASRLNGELYVANIGSPQVLIDDQPSQLYLAEREDAERWLKQTEFSADSYKNRRGHSLIVAGSADYSGAAVLAANAAMRSGVGLVTLVTPGSSKASVESRVLPEVMVRGIAETDDGAIAEEALDEIGDLFAKADAVAIGSGLSLSESTCAFVHRAMTECCRPMILDADALNALAPFETNWPPANVGGSDLILTPHEGEFMRLLGTDDREAIKDRVSAVRDFSTQNGVTLVLKGERVLIGSPDGRVVVNPTGNSGLGKAGNGDTLTGILTGFVAQAVKMNTDIFETVVAGVYVAGMAGDVAEKRFGKRVMTASDVRECLSDVFREFESV